MNLTTTWFGFAASSIILGGVIVNFFEKKIPFIGEVFRYGKFTVEQKGGLVNKLVLEIPKSYFKHFYRFAVICFTFAFYHATLVYVFDQNVPKYLIDLVDFATTEERVAKLSATRVYLAMLLMTIQVYRRFYDTHFVSVFGKNSKMNIIHYALGILHYPGAAIAILCEAPKFAASNTLGNDVLNISSLNLLDYFAVVLFLWAWWHQHITTKILANLRKNKKGEIVTSEHKLPFGDWFEYLSSPPQIAEILMYTSLTLLLYKNTTWWYVYAWVLTNQVETIMLSHWWYTENFKNFPKKRKALVPFYY